ncbi:MAG: hypothetical protein V3T33_00385 [Myxococcota bacterium]
MLTQSSIHSNSNPEANATSSNRRPVVIAALAVAVYALTSLGCVSVPHRHGHEPSPPPWAPAHGHRDKHHGKHDDHHGGDAKMVFDSGLGVYVVVDLPDVYFFDGVYFYFDDGAWLIGANLDGPWRPAKADRLPPGLRKEHPGRGHGRGHRKDAPARHR